MRTFADCMRLSGVGSYMTLAIQRDDSSGINPPVFMRDMTVLLLSQDIATCNTIMTQFCPR